MIFVAFLSPNFFFILSPKFLDASLAHTPHCDWYKYLLTYCENGLIPRFNPLFRTSLLYCGRKNPCLDPQFIPSYFCFLTITHELEHEQGEINLWPTPNTGQFVSPSPLIINIQWSHWIKRVCHLSSFENRAALGFPVFQSSNSQAEKNIIRKIPILLRFSKNTRPRPQKTPATPFLFMRMSEFDLNMINCPG